MIGTRAEYAKHAGISRAYVTQLIQKGVLTARKDGKLNFKKADKERAAKINAHNVPVQIKTGKGPNRGSKPKDQARQTANIGAPDEAPDGPLTFNAARTATEAFRAKKMQLEYEEKLGQLLPKRGVEEGMVEGARIIRRNLDAIIASADEIHAAGEEGGAMAIRVFLIKRIREVETTISDALTDRMREVVNAGK